MLDARKSSIYRNRPRFSVFGHGSYTYTPYKVAISGLHKEPAFRLVAPIAEHPVVLDDTCYFLPFDDATEAALTWAIRTSRASTDLIQSLVFWDAKRPINKRILSRIELFKLPFDQLDVVEAAAKEAARMGIPFDERRVHGFFDQAGPRTAPFLFGGAAS
ncbi:hypothetical protein [Phytoactinopolyspora limicola]|uniref:hypothetical protein n=1 Tax=Phytoactinopolyspora limicola TaxID=2715536 RepID=UPI00140CA156|nr:hypothetical protein [Phytoactinopolyspora limicola]